MLGAQPTPPGVTPLNLLSTESDHSEGNFPPPVIRFEDEPASLQLAVNQLLEMDSSDSVIQVPVSKLANSFFLYSNYGANSSRGFPSRRATSPGTQMPVECFECGETRRHFYEFPKNPRSNKPKRMGSPLRGHGETSYTCRRSLNRLRYCSRPYPTIRSLTFNLLPSVLRFRSHRPTRHRIFRVRWSRRCLAYGLPPQIL